MNDTNIDTNHELLDTLRNVVTVVDRIAAQQGAPDHCVETLYPDQIDADELRLAAETNQDLLRFDTIVERLPGSGLTAVQYRHRYACDYRELETLLQYAAEQAGTTSLAAYFRAAATYIHTGITEDYTEMMHAWVESWDNPICFPLVLDETYSDTLFGLKGTMDAALFMEDTALSHLLNLPQATWTAFAATIPVPGSPEIFLPTSSRIFKTLALGGSLPAMQLRAWNLPNDYSIRSE